MSSASSLPPLFWNEAASKANAIKLIESHKGKLSLTSSGVDLLRSQTTNASLNLAFVFGNARSGKSYLMNCLTGKHGNFEVVNSSQPVTKGCDISSTMMPHSSLDAHVKSLPITVDDIQLEENGKAGAASSRTARKAATQPVKIGFVDVEGQGAEDNSYDTMLALPLLLTSKVVIFNHKGAPTVSEMLSKLGVLARAADYVDTGNKDDDDNGSDNGEHGTSSGSIASARAESGGKKFGHLHVVFRDFSFEGDEDSVYNQLLGLEALPRKSAGLKNFNKKSDGDRENDAIKAVEERNNIRNLLVDNFASIRIWLLKQPASADQLKAHKELPEELVDPEFVREIHRMSIVLSQQLRAPTLFEGQPLTGPAIATLLAQITHSLNTSGAISVPSVFKAMEDEAVNRIYKLVLADWEARTERIKKLIPMAKKNLQAELINSQQKAYEMYDEELADCVLQEERTKLRAELVTTITRAHEALVVQNGEQLVQLIRKSIMEATSNSKSRLEAFCAKVIPIEESRVLEGEFASIKADHLLAIQTDLKVHGNEVFEMSEYKFALLEAEETLTEFYSYKLVCNDAEVKSAKILRLQEEAIAQQKLLVEQNQRLEQYLDDEKRNTAEMEKELARLRQDRDDEKQRVEAERKRFEELSQELENVRKKKKGCTIL